MSDNSDSDAEVYSYTSSKTIYKRTRSRPSSPVPTESDYRATQKVYYETSDVDDLVSEYMPVTRWAVDYNNKNYIRSLCNKNQGLHRKLKGRPRKFKIHYDNNYFTRSKVNEPKGLHRRVPEMKRKYVPDDDDLANATGWEFDYGPEIDQIEQDICYIPEGRITRRGCFRWYGVKRNDSDYDLKLDEERQNLLNEKLIQELKNGQEFLQADIPYLEEPKNRRYTKGGYRFYETLRNVNDFKLEELAESMSDPEWRRKYNTDGIRYMDLEICDCDRDEVPGPHHHPEKGKKPFRHTVLNKVYELKKEDSSKDLKRLATRLSLVPGEGRQSLYEGVPDRLRYQTEKSPSIQSVYKRKVEKYRSGKEGEDYEEYEKEHTKQSYMELRPEREERLHRAEIRHGRNFPDEKLVRKERKKNGGYDEYSYKVKIKDEDRPRRRRYKDQSDPDVKESFATRNEVVGRRRNNENYYDHEERRSQRPESGSRDYHHGNQIHKQTEVKKVKNKATDRRHIDAHANDINKRRRGTRGVYDFEADLNPIKEQDLKKMSRRFEGRSRNMEERREMTKDKEQVLKKMPSHVEERVKTIRKRMEQKLQLVDPKNKDQNGRNPFDQSSSEDSIDLMKHKGHPRDTGETHDSEYEKYITKTGSEMWLKKKEKYSELHHKNNR